MDRINEFQPNEFRSVVDRWGSLMVVGRAHGSVAVPESLRGSAAVRIWALVMVARKRAQEREDYGRRVERKKKRKF